MMHGRTPDSILVAEDNPADRRLLREAFREAEIAVDLRFASDGVEALAQLRDETIALPDLVVVDLNMPRMDGRTLMAEMRTDPRLEHIPVVVLSTSHYEKDILAARRTGARAYVVKPTVFGEFVAAVRKIMQTASEVLDNGPPRA